MLVSLDCDGCDNNNLQMKKVTVRRQQQILAVFAGLFAIAVFARLFAAAQVLDSGKNLVLDVPGVSNLKDLSSIGAKLQLLGIATPASVSNSQSSSLSNSSFISIDYEKYSPNRSTKIDLAVTAD
ncbi:hypothetical protein L1987_15048 [Smallanthus sonchifolius]|uniref:Uncharacterized protein n=1 Tax=Smallanthus sonchifolius TaxID=185202 RepID=A0ACB9J800_9ASTR|nr:hypothetical protein L1987_15048 [Smallanthus sonchifolius]